MTLTYEHRLSTTVCRYVYVVLSCREQMVLVATLNSTSRIIIACLLLMLDTLGAVATTLKRGV